MAELATRHSALLTRTGISVREHLVDASGVLREEGTLAPHEVEAVSERVVIAINDPVGE